MTNWLQQTTLKGENVTLLPLTVALRDDLLEVAKDGNLWELWYTGVPSEETIDNYIKIALEHQQNGTTLPFVIQQNSTGKIVGCSRYCNVVAANRRVEIGYTWYAKSVQRTAINTEAKLLLLNHAFETLNCIAVEFRTHWHNTPSRNAILRLGAKQDGVLRNHLQDADGAYRDTVVFSIINSEWPTVKKGLKYKLK
jgi:RimJ/RimL family protein N-acetyltransferase